MTTPQGDMSPVLKARLGGFCWLMCFLTSGFAMSSATKLIVPRDAAVTAATCCERDALPIGALMMFAGVGWLTFVYPPLANSLAPFNMAPGGIGELALTLWLLIKGVNVER